VSLYIGGEPSSLDGERLVMMGHLQYADSVIDMSDITLKRRPGTIDSSSNFTRMQLQLEQEYPYPDWNSRAMQIRVNNKVLFYRPFELKLLSAQSKAIGLSAASNIQIKMPILDSGKKAQTRIEMYEQHS